MAHSQLPCPLFLLCSLLMLPSVLLQEVGMPGGIVTRSVTDEDVQEAAAFAVEKYNEGSGNANYFKELSIESAQSQVVSGYIYYLTVALGETVCEKSNGLMPFKDIQKCERSGQQKELICDFHVFYPPSLGETASVGMVCSNLDV